MPRPVVLFLLCVLASCAQPDLMLATTSDVQVVPGPRDCISDVTVIDAREGAPTAGSISKPAGTEVATSTGTIPPIEFVAASMRAGLARRLMLSPSAPYRMEVTLTRFAGSNYFGAQAGVAMRLAVLDRTNRVIYRSDAADAGGAQADSGTTSPGVDLLFAVLGGPRERRQYQANRRAETGNALQHTLGTVTDRLLDNVNLWNAVRTPGSV